MCLAQHDFLIVALMAGRNFAARLITIDSAVSDIDVGDGSEQSKDRL
jgi:hypothetical protein